MSDRPSASDAAPDNEVWNPRELEQIKAELSAKDFRDLHLNQFIPPCPHCGQPMQDDGLRDYGIGINCKAKARLWVCQPCGCDMFDSEVIYE